LEVLSDATAEQRARLAAWLATSRSVSASRWGFAAYESSSRTVWASPAETLVLPCQWPYYEMIDISQSERCSGAGTRPYHGTNTGSRSEGMTQWSLYSRCAASPQRNGSREYPGGLAHILLFVRCRTLHRVLGAMRARSSGRISPRHFKRCL